jgi:3-oxoacyl-[acyl-carrier protein] reductase
VALAEQRGARAIGWRLDLGEPDSLAAAVEQARRELGPIDVLVNNAVRWPDRPEPGELFETAPPERFTASVGANLTGPDLLARAVVADMRGRGWGASSTSPPAWSRTASRATSPTSRPKRDCTA